jgi:hypothetical protein
MATDYGSSQPNLRKVREGESVTRSLIPVRLRAKRVQLATAEVLTSIARDDATATYGFQL